MGIVSEWEIKNVDVDGKVGDVVKLGDDGVEGVIVGAKGSL